MRWPSLVVFAFVFVTPTLAHEYKIGDIAIIHPWARATPAGASVAAGYITALRNDGADDALVSVAAEAAASAQIHETKEEGGVMQMRPVAALALPAKATVEIKPGGYHIMFTGLKAPLKPGDKFHATLNFSHAGAIKVDFQVEAIGAAAPAAMQDMPGMDGK